MNTFLNVPTNLTTKFINSELQKYIDLDRSYFVSKDFRLSVTVPYKAYFEFKPEYIKHTSSKYTELGLETRIINGISMRQNDYIKYLSYNMSYQFKNNVFAEHIYKYKPVTYVCPKENTRTVMRSIMVHAAYKNKPVFVFNDELQFVDACANQRDCEHIFKPLLERIHWFRTTIHAQFMSELHFMLLDCDITHRILNIITLFPTVLFKAVRDEHFEPDY